MLKQRSREPIGASLPHDSAVLHVTGRAQYTDDIPLPAGTLHAAFATSTVAHGRLVGLDGKVAAGMPGVMAIASAMDVPGENNYGSPLLRDDPIFAADLVWYAGQPLCAVAATSYGAARRAAAAVRASYEEMPAILDARAAIAAGSFVLPTEHARRGDPDAALAAAPNRLQGTLAIGGQDHFYLEGQIAAAVPQDDGGVLIYSSTQHPTEVQHAVAHALGVAVHRVTIVCRRMGGGFGGKESQPALLAAAAAILAVKTRAPVKLRLDRDADMLVTGKRHDFIADYEAGFDDAGRLGALKVMLASRCGYSADLSGPVNDRAMFHVDNAYFLEHVDIVSHRCRTHTVSNTAFRGFGGPQGMMVIEAVLDDIARLLKRDPLDVRRANFYGTTSRNVTHYGQVLEDNIVADLVTRLEQSSDYRARRAALARWNAGSASIKRGLALTPVKFGISFTSTMYNQAGALLHVYADGSVLLNHGGTEMGQGLHVKVQQVVAAELGLRVADVRITATDTSKVPNTSATAASAGADLNGMAACIAARELKRRLVEHLCATRSCDAAAITFADGNVYLDGAGERSLSFAQLAAEAYAARVSLSATGFYRTPKIHWDKQSWRGRPFFYFAYGAAVAEVAIDTRTGETALTRIDILHDVGDSLNPAIDMGQVEGGFLQGVGWLTSEELWWDERGRLRTHAPSTYKIPTVRDWPRDAHVELLAASPNREDTIHRSKAVGEPPLMLAIAVFHAIRGACDAAVPGAGGRLQAPATPEAVLRALAAITAEHAA